jgi:RNA polymerase sigma-70 factor, ECF subfamily
MTRVAAFEPHRSYLRGLAYRMLGSQAEAEDAVQDAWLRWNGADASRVQNPRAFLAQTVTRLCLDRLKSAQAQREHYVGPWLPEPVVERLEADDDPALAAERAADVSVAFMLALERLSPLERAAFLLHDVFDCDFAEIAEALERSPAACRQLAARAREQLRSERPRFRPRADEARRLLDAFEQAIASGDATRFKALLAEDVRFVSDGGGRIAAPRIVVAGLQRVAKAVLGLIGKHPPPPGSRYERARINGLPGLVVRGPDGRAIQTVALEADAHWRISALYIVRNPDKLQRL